MADMFAFVSERIVVGGLRGKLVLQMQTFTRNRS